MKIQIIGFAFFLLVLTLLVSYWFIPTGSLSLKPKYGHSNFTLNLGENMQFYPNMRYASPNISFKIYDCPLSKINDVEEAFGILSNKTILRFYPVEENEEISVNCDGHERIEEGLFIAGEGGPTNITQLDKFNLILNGKILLIKSSKCNSPNVAIHELLHALGFKHSLNPDNIMYNISECSQKIGEDTIKLINDLYSFPNYPDLALINVSVSNGNRYLDLNFSIKNNGFSTSNKSAVLIYINEKKIKKINVKEIAPGYGKIISLKNIFVPQLKIKNIKLILEYEFPELNKENNQVVLE